MSVQWHQLKDQLSAGLRSKHLPIIRGPPDARDTRTEDVERLRIYS